jgi:alpha-L-fucosidase 2
MRMNRSYARLASVGLGFAIAMAMQTAAGDEARSVYELWEAAPAPNRGADYNQVQSRGYPYDRDWEHGSHPIGNGYIGANLFGRTDTERVQITDKTLHVEGPYPARGGLSNFAELHLDFAHEDPADYRRALSLNEAIAYVGYESGGVRYTREYFASYPDKVLVIRLAADTPKSMTFSVRPTIPYVNARQPGDRRTAALSIDGNLITLSGTTAFFPINYEAQIKVLNEGGDLSQHDDRITVTGADRVTLLLATGTNFRQGPHVFLHEPSKKLDPNQYPHAEVSETIRRAAEKGYAALKADHLADYQNLFGRVAIRLNSQPSPLPTSRLLEEYKRGRRDTWLEELMFQYGRYLLIASSREKSLPANLQGVWSQYEVSPWSGGYWHNINVQMNYWGAMNTNLAETFEAYIAYFRAYLPKARQYAGEYVKRHKPDRLDAFGGDNGWIVGTGASVYHISGPGGHSGPGTGGFTAKLLMDYYLFTGDKAFLDAIAYPALLSLSKFYVKALAPHGDLWLVEPSASPEQRADKRQLAGMPGHILESGHYVTAGCTFDQGFVWETFNDTLIAAKALGRKDPFLKSIEEVKAKLDPILIGTSGQIKEYREENAYSDIGDPKHRHISHLCPLYPGTLITSAQPEWMNAAMKTLDLRGDQTTGWAIAHRMNCRARLRQGDKAHALLQRLISEKTVPNLWTLHPPFQIDGNLGAMAGVAEMLLQSHEGWIDLLPALPNAWKNGMFKGLVARGNFVVDAEWTDGQATRIVVTSRTGGVCRIAHPGIGEARVVNAAGAPMTPASGGQPDRIAFNIAKGETYTLVYSR